MPDARREAHRSPRSRADFPHFIAIPLGRFVHVWVDRISQRPLPIPERIRAALEPLVVSREDAH